jgi:hypothetical protein
MGRTTSGDLPVTDLVRDDVTGDLNASSDFGVLAPCGRHDDMDGRGARHPERGGRSADHRAWRQDPLWGLGSPRRGRE